MKKAIILSLIAFVFSNCEISTRKASANSDFGGYESITKIEKGMEYLFVYKKMQSSQTGYAIAIVNLTKDSLEVELLKKQLKK